MLDQRGGPISAAAQLEQRLHAGRLPGHAVPRPAAHADPQPAPPRRRQRRPAAQRAGPAQPAQRRTTTSVGPTTAELAARIASYELAFRMQTDAPEAVDLSQEPDATLAPLRPGRRRGPEPFGRQCLMARRLVERGVRFVQVYIGGGHIDQNWDAHGDVLKQPRAALRRERRPAHRRPLDRPQAARTARRRRWWCGRASSAGRRPAPERQGPRPQPARLHDLAGRRRRQGRRGLRRAPTTSATRRSRTSVHVHDLHATILHLLGLDHKRLTYFHGGRDMRLTDVSGRVIQEVIG